jgi:HK97 family phage major capsid protein
MLKKRMEEIVKRLGEIKAETEKPDADLNALEEESRNLTTEYEELRTRVEEAERRQRILNEAAESGLTVRNFAPQAAPEARSYNADSPEYRSAFLKRMRGIELTEVEERAMSSAEGSVGATIPTQTVNKIIEKVHQYAPLLSKIDLVSVPGYVKIPTEGTTTDAAIHAEGETIKAGEDTINYIQLGMYEITKLLTISKTVELMSVDAFETWLTDKLARTIAEKITGYILVGTGTNEPQGIDAIAWDENNSVTVAAGKSLAVSDLDTTVGLLNGGYDSGAEWVMSKRTFFNDFRALQDNAKNKVIWQEGGNWYVEGYPVTFDDRLKEHDAILGNLRLGYVGNMPQTATVTGQFVTRENSYDFLGAAMFDGRVQAVEAFVKLTKATE